ncbi:multidrug efflux transporter transmembrane domain-containing [Pyrrhoderma noxium]|uniref:Multidrug efflux transporter transmembrane domain-containing n=1 Tax=Pyrrhoderma noxium TaxID=2282107 RepID=A0A286UN95_9AGAM|nr:multidrug efflux transporter transmembrane domain-containing [Pyrrhoderma noxium]
MFGKSLPCPYDGLAQEPDNDSTRELLQDVCGPQFAEGPVCCTQEQVEVLKDNFDTVEVLLASCPACRNNFRSFFCSFTCSPDQATFLNVTATQLSYDKREAVKSVDFFVGDRFSQGFFNSCKDVKLSAANDYVMTVIGGGAKDARSFLKYLGDEKDIGSPFQIDFSYNTSSEFTSFDPPPRKCSDNDLESRCACVDCEDVCQALPPVSPPNSDISCRVGGISCLSFALTNAYGLIVVFCFLVYAWRLVARNRKDKKFDRLTLPGEDPSDNPLSPRSHTRSLLGASSLPQDGEETIGLYRDSRNLGWKDFQVERDPVRLWVAPDSESKLQKEYFDQHFGPFYRPQQIFITSTQSTASNTSQTSLSPTFDYLPPVLSYEHLKWWFDVESNIRSLRSSRGYELSDVCFKPSGPGTPCVVQSVTAWFDYEIDGYEDLWEERLMNCASAPGECLPDFKQPLGPQYARALVVNIVIDDSLDTEKQEMAMDWERSLREYLLHINEVAPEEVGLNIHFSTGVSLEEELNKSTNTDVKIVVLSYLVMFFYVAISLGNNSAGQGDGVVSSLKRWIANLPRYFSTRLSPWASLVESEDEEPRLLPRLPRNLFVNSKFTLGLFGIVLVILSVSSSVGFFSAAGVKVTLIIAEVIPFLVLAVGVDNVFILVHELDRQNLLHGPNAPTRGLGVSSITSASITNQARASPLTSSHDESADAVSAPNQLPPEERVARALAKMGPSILLSSITEVTAFALGALVPMPAVRNFALYAAGSVFLNAALQITVFVSALAIDLRRIEADRIDCFPCIRLPRRIALPDTHSGVGTLTKFIRRKYAPFLLKPVVKVLVLLLFGGIFVCSVISIQHIQLGLDQRLALPSDSYLVPYFDALEKYLDIGPPVYFVSTGVNVTDRSDQRHLCGRFTTCDGFSLANVLEAERKRPESSFINQPSASWIDDYLHWLDPANDCCRVRKAKPDIFCKPRDSPRLCRPCWEGHSPAWNITMDGLPEGEEFAQYLKQWLQSPADEACALGGQAAYSTALSMDSDSQVTATHFRTFHSPLRTQADFINSLEAARRIASDISERIGSTVFPYSLHYVFFDQYIHIIAITQEILGLGLAAVLIITSLLLGSWRTGSIVTFVVALTVTNVMGVMGIWGINLNAVSLVNLVISLGIAVEFCAHIARAFMGAGTGLPVDLSSRQKERDERMWIGLVDVGPSVLSGITFTKLIGISVLVLTRSRLLEVYYFRMWLALIISGALHGFVLLPVVLSFAGGRGYALEDADEEWMSSIIRRNDYTPFLADDESDHSD